MIWDYKSIDDNLKKQIVSSFEKSYKISEIQNEYPFLDYNVLYSVIYSTNRYNKELNNQIYQLKTNDDIVIFMSDTHDGSKYENQYYKDQIFDFAVTNGVETIFHCGDYIQSYNENYKYIINNKDVINQAQRFIDKYPSDPSITTYGIYGNHDYDSIMIDEDVKRILESRSDFKTLGFKKAYILWHGHIISLQHDIKNFKLSLPLESEYLSFKGHSHVYHVKKVPGRKGERIYVPASCDDDLGYSSEESFVKKNNLNFTPGFLTAEHFRQYIIVTYFSFKYGTIIREDEFIKPKKKLIIK